MPENHANFASMDAPSPPPARRDRRTFLLRTGVVLSVASVPLLLLMLVGSCAREGSWWSWKGGSAKNGSGAGISKKTRFGKIDTSSRKLVYHGEGHADLGVYSIKTFDPVSHTCIRTVFRLEGLTDCQNKQTFHQFMDGNYRFFREQVMITIRGSDIGDLVNPNRTLLGKKLIARVNRALGYPFLKSIHFSEFEVFESVQDSGFSRWEETEETEQPRDGGNHRLDAAELGAHSPMILTSTRFGRRPSNSP